MVRVIAAHHFASQAVRTVEQQPTAAAMAPPNRLLLALSSHSIEVRDLQLDADVLFAFPTVDEVVQLCHCVNGDYVATLETKRNRQNRALNFARVYVNWDSVGALQQSKTNESGASECGMVQPMRARIAGRVTPTSSQSELASLEMIEMPVARNPRMIAVCQTSGNLVIGDEDAHLTFYRFAVRTHDISKLKFVDFEHAGVEIALPFRPLECHLAENYVACMSADSMHLFRVHQEAAPPSAAAAANESTFSDAQPIDFRRAVDAPGVRVHLPSVARANSAIQRHTPFAFIDRELRATVAPSNGGGAHWRIDDLIQLRLQPVAVAEQFRCVVLKPLYVDEAAASKAKEGAAGGGGGERPLRSAFTGNLHSVACLVGTQQEAYMYHFVDGCAPPGGAGDECVTAYAFTAPVRRVVLEDYLLHALTGAGVESYTLRLCHRVCESMRSARSVCPASSEPVCLIGVRPFVAVDRLLASARHLVLLAGDTLYALALPPPAAVHADVAGAAHAHRAASPPTYAHLLGEAHMVLRAALLLYGWTWGGSVRTARPLRAAVDALAAHDASAALLADHHMASACAAQHALAAAYYQMAGVTDPLAVVERVRRMRAPPTAGLVAYLRTALTAVVPPASRAKLCDAALQVYAAHAPAALPALVLRAPLLRDHATDRLIALLQDVAPDAADRHLALGALLALRGDAAAAGAHLAAVDDDALGVLLADHWQLLFEHAAAFSELAALLTTTRGALLAAVFAGALERRALSLGRLLRAFADCLPAAGEAPAYGRVLQATLERHLRQHADAHDALRLLVRSYLAQLLQPADGGSHLGDGAPYLCMQQRHAYLDRLPPFAPPEGGHQRADVALRKLQALLCARALPAAVVAEVAAFVSAHDALRGRLALQVCVAGVGDALALLVDERPQCALLYAQEVCARPDEWKLLIATVQRKIVSVALDAAAITSYKQLLHDILAHVAVTMSVEQLAGVFPQRVDDDADGGVDAVLAEIQDYAPYVALCSETSHANQIRRLITATGEQLLGTLHL